jgi:tyrosine-protein phosphatase YwqE
MLRWFKKSSPILEPIDFSVVGVDLHSHLIPGIDDGVKDLDDSVTIIKELKDQGFSKIITTPHIMSDLYKNTPETINSGLEILKRRLENDNIEINISAAAEYYVDYDFEQRIGNENFLTFGEKYILIEFSFLESPRNMYDIIFKLQLEGYVVVLAHPARYQYFDLKDYESLINRGVLFQLNLLSLIGYYSNQVKANAKLLIDNKFVSFVGTDCHNLNHARLYPKCMISKSWHELVNSGILINSKL